MRDDYHEGILMGLRMAQKALNFSGVEAPDPDLDTRRGWVQEMINQLEAAESVDAFLEDFTPTSKELDEYALKAEHTPNGTPLADK